MQYDLAIVGAGPAGLATAINAAKKGLKVHVFERREVLGDRPGESLHPGVSVILKQLDVDLDSLGFARFPAIFHKTERQRIGFGGTADEPWLGYQAIPKTLDEELLRVARHWGVHVSLGCAVRGIELTKGGYRLTLYDNSTFAADWLVDAAGHRGINNAQWTRVSPSLYAGWTLDAASESTQASDWEPTFCARSDGWTYQARITNSIISTTELSLLGHKPSRPKAALSYRGFDVTWRHRLQIMRPRMFRVGDAAFTVDPAGGKGVLRALMSGIMAAHCLLECPKQAIDCYQEWALDWFKSETKELAQIYAQEPFCQGWADKFSRQDM